MSRRSISMCSARISGALLALNVLVAGAIDAPAPPVPAASAHQAPPPGVDVAPSDETAFYERLQYVSHKRTLTGLGVSEEVLKSLAGGSVEMAITTLGSQSAAGDRNATIALVRIQHWCSRVGSTKPADAQTQFVQAGADAVSAASGARGGCIRSQNAPIRRVHGRAAARRRSTIAELNRDCAARPRQVILRAPLELAQFVRDPAQREALQQQAADRSYAPAMYALATNRVVAVQRGQTTENVGSIRLLLKQAGRTLPKAKVDLANCMALACDGHPADASRRCCVWYRCSTRRRAHGISIDDAHALGRRLSRAADPGAGSTSAIASTRVAALAMRTCRTPSSTRKP